MLSLQLVATKIIKNQLLQVERDRFLCFRSVQNSNIQQLEPHVSRIEPCWSVFEQGTNSASSKGASLMLALHFDLNVLKVKHECSSGTNEISHYYWTALNNLMWCEADCIRLVFPPSFQSIDWLINWLIGWLVKINLINIAILGRTNTIKLLMSCVPSLIIMKL